MIVGVVVRMPWVEMRVHVSVFYVETRRPAAFRLCLLLDG
jgi:hypothetical protein